MKSKAVVSAIVALSLTTGGFAFAQDGGDHNSRGRNEQAQNGDQQNRHDNGARAPARSSNRGHSTNNRRQDERGAGSDHAFHRGERLPAQYRTRSYVVNDWRGHHLSAPPRGYHWVQTGGDFVLVAIGSGIIPQLMLNH